MTDLHETLTAAVTARIELAQAAQVARPGPWRAVATHIGGTPDEGWRILAEETTTTRLTCRLVVNFPLHPIDRHEGRHTTPIDLAAHLVAHDPATAIRHCERDLRVLKRHELFRCGTPGCKGFCGRCALEIDDCQGPCDDIREMAACYGIEVNG